MPEIIEYDIVLEQMRRQGMRCLYYNSGAFGFVDQSDLRLAGWIGPDDPTIRQSVRPMTRSVPPPYESNLVERFVQAWRQHLPGPVWLMPKSHWAYELDHGSSAWMPALLQSVGVDPQPLRGRTNAPAIAFAMEEVPAFETVARGLLEKLVGSDFTIAFPGRPVLCTLHHHKQLWWMMKGDAAGGWNLDF